MGLVFFFLKFSITPLVHNYQHFYHISVQLYLSIKAEMRKLQTKYLIIRANTPSSRKAALSSPYTGDEAEG